MGFITNATAQGLISACERQGVARHALLVKARLSESQVVPEARLAEEDLHRLWSAALELSGDQDLSIHSVEALPHDAFGVIDFMVAHAPSLGEGLERAARYFTLIHTGVRLKTVAGDLECYLDVGLSRAPGAARPAGEFSLAAFARRIRQNVGEHLTFLRVECAYEEPQERRELDRFFRSPIVFGAASNRLVLSPADWHQAPLKSEPRLFFVLEDHARRIEEELPCGAPWSAQVRRLLAEELTGGRPLAVHIAKQLGLSERSLQRRLKEEGAAFSEILDELRAHYAALYLKHESLAQAEIAHLLGFSDVSAFHRAHRRWTGRAPGDV